MAGFKGVAKCKGRAIGEQQIYTSAKGSGKAINLSFAVAKFGLPDLVSPALVQSAQVP